VETGDVATFPALLLLLVLLLLLLGLWSPDTGRSTHSIERCCANSYSQISIQSLAKCGRADAAAVADVPLVRTHAAHPGGALYSR
jgi:hypothetical protein